MATEAFSDGGGDRVLAASPATARMAFLLVAIAPVFFATVTWNEIGPADRFGHMMRLIGAPIHLLEICFIVLALRLGWQPSRQFSAISRLGRSLLIALPLVAFGTAAFRAPNPAGSLVWTYLSLLQLLFGFAAAWLVARADMSLRRLVWPAIVCGCVLYGLMLALFALSFWTGSRGAAIAAIVAIGGAMVLLPRLRTWRGLLLSAGPIVLGAILSLPLPRPIGVYGVHRMASSLQAATPDAISGFRLRMWEDALHAVLQRPWFGYGEGQFGLVAPQPQAVYLHPHDIILQLLVQWGLVGTLVSASLLLMLVVRVRRGVDWGSAPVIPALLVAFGLLAFSFFDGALFHAYPVMMFSFAVAFIVGSSGAGPADRLARRA